MSKMIVCNISATGQPKILKFCGQLLKLIWAIHRANLDLAIWQCFLGDVELTAW
jgi:hypothetical protein